MPVTSALPESFLHSFPPLKCADDMGSQSGLKCLRAIPSPRLTFRAVFHVLAGSDHICFNLNRTCIHGVIIILNPASHLGSLPS